MFKSEELQRLIANNRAWASLGQVISIEPHASYGYLLNLKLQPGEREVQARMGVLGSDTGAGLLFPVKVGAEVLVWFPGGDANQAIAIGGLSSSASPLPTNWANDKPLLVHPLGFTVTLTQEGIFKALLTEDLTGDLAAALTEIKAALTALALPTVNLDNLLIKLPTLYRTLALKSE